MNIRFLLITLTTLCFPLFTSAQVKSDIIERTINDWRSEGCNCGTKEANSTSRIRWNDDLAQVAQDYAFALAKAHETNGGFVYLSHVGLDGSSLEDRLNRAGFEAQICLENLAYIHGKFEYVIDHWMNNPEACLNIMDKRVNCVGAGRSGDFWVLLLAEPGKKKNNK